MFSSPWIHKLLGAPHSRKQRRRQAVQTRRPVRLMLESLEERLTPAGGNPTVTQTAGGYTALTGLIKSDTAANTNYVIQITNSFTFNSGGQVAISKLGSGSTLTLKGQSGSGTTLTGIGNRLFDIAVGQTVTLSSLILTGGSGVSDGGAILDAGGSATLSGMTVKTNTATAKANGGGIYVVVWVALLSRSKNTNNILKAITESSLRNATGARKTTDFFVVFRDYGVISKAGLSNTHFRDNSPMFRPSLPRRFRCCIP